MKKLTSILSLAALLVITCEAVAQTSLNSALSNAVTTCTLTSTNVTGARPIDVWQGRGMSFSPRFVGTQSTNTGTIAFLFATSQDGTNYTTTAPIVIYSTANATTAVRDFTNVPPTVLDNVRKIKLLTITNALANMASIHVTNVFIGVKN